MRLIEEEKNEINRQKSLMHVRLNNLKKMKNDLRDELLADFKKKEEVWIAKLQRMPKLEEEIEANKREKSALLGAIKELEGKLKVTEQTFTENLRVAKCEAEKEANQTFKTLKDRM